MRKYLLVLAVGFAFGWSYSAHADITYCGYQDVFRHGERTIIPLYQQILRRQPDCAGYMSHYRAILYGYVNASGLRVALAKSPEARRLINTQVYGAILGREGEDAGLTYWQNAMAYHGWTAGEIIRWVRDCHAAGQCR